MTIDFFKKECQEKTTAEQFGLMDLDDKTPAYVNKTDKEDWIAIIHNEKQQEITFTAIDNCIPIYRADGNMESRCDGMLTHANNIDFVELKEVRKDWIEGGIKQLKKTIEIFSANHQLADYTKKRAFLANKKHPQFKYSHKEQMQQFRNELGVRLIIENVIKI